MKRIYLLATFLLLALVAGCSSKAGPFVTNISSNGSQGIVVEKCMVNLNRMITTVENSDCNNHVITLDESN